jgi:hypothetical protein
MAEYKCEHGWTSPGPYCPECISDLVRERDEAAAGERREFLRAREVEAALRSAYSRIKELMMVAPIRDDDGPFLQGLIDVMEGRKGDG